jgi:hypothetical protein
MQLHFTSSINFPSLFSFSSSSSLLHLHALHLQASDPRISLGQSRATSLYLECIDARERAADASRAVDLATTYNKLGKLYAKPGPLQRLEQARNCHVQALEILEDTVAPDNPDRQDTEKLVKMYAEIIRGH